jgi:hypothetical protein
MLDSVGSWDASGTIGMAIWSPTEAGTDFGLGRRVPIGISRLDSPTLIRLR